MMKFRLRLTWPGEDDTDFLVLDSDGNTIGRIYREIATSQGRWQFFVGLGNLPRRPDFTGYVYSLDEAKACFTALWPAYRTQWSDEEYEKALRELSRAQLTPDARAGVLLNRGC